MMPATALGRERLVVSRQGLGGMGLADCSRRSLARHVAVRDLTGRVRASRNGSLTERNCA
jgi:hypothetical protein